MIIINGLHLGEPIGQLIAWDGHLVSVWSTSPFDLLNATTEAIGPVPQPPSLGLGGTVEVLETSDQWTKRPPQIVYNPAGDVANQCMAQMFQSQVLAWNQRAILIQQAIAAIVAAGGKK